MSELSRLMESDHYMIDIAYHPK